MKNKLLLSVALVSVSCATSSAPKVNHRLVDVTSNPDVVKGCTRLGNVSLDSWDVVLKEKNHVEDLQTHVAERGGDTLFLNAGGTTGEAYRCR